MLQIVLEEPGRFARRDVPEPTPAEGEALVRVHRVGICGTDLHAFAGRQPFFTYPRVLGHELGVEVIEAPADSGFNPGDRCSIEPYINDPDSPASQAGKPNCCENIRVLGVHTDGGMGALLAVPARKLHRSSTLDFDQLALVETICIGAHGVERAAVEAGQNVLVIGAGPIGLGAMQSAKARGARVIVMDISKERLAFATTAGRIDATVRAGMDDTEALVREACGGGLPHAVIDATGNKRSMEAAFSLVAHGGRLVFLGLIQDKLHFFDPDFHKRELTVLASRNALAGDFHDVITAMEDGRIDTAPWITHRLTLDEVPDRFATISKDPALVKGVISVE